MHFGKFNEMTVVYAAGNRTEDNNSGKQNLTRVSKKQMMDSSQRKCNLQDFIYLHISAIN